MQFNLSTGDKLSIKVMPDREMLEAFLRGMHGQPEVLFNSDTGEFEWGRDDRSERPDPRKV